MPRRVACIIGLVLLLGLGLKLERYGAQPLGPEAAATTQLAREMQDAGWQPLGARPLLTDGSLSAQGFLRGACRMQVVLLPPGQDYVAVVREAWGDRARVLDNADGPAQGRLAVLVGQLGWAMGLGSPPVLFHRAVATDGDCPAWPMP